MKKSYILTLQCLDRPGIVAAVANCLFVCGGNITEAHRFDETETGRFFMRVELRFAAANDHWELNFGVRDLTDKVYPVAGNSSLSTAAGYAEIAYNRGREGTATFTVNF